MTQTALVTGASAGIGLDLARLLAKDKHDLVLVARRRDRLDALATELAAAHGVKVHVVPADLMDAAAPAHIAGEVARLGVEIGVLVNNAGFGTNGKFWELDDAKELGEVQVNVTALVALTRAFLPGMVARRRGRVLNVGSTAGFQPGPFMATYYASKAFVNSFTEALSYELRGTGVTATVSCPGPTKTEFAAIAGNEKSRLFALGQMTSAAVAAKAYRAMWKGKPLIVHGAPNRIAALLTRLSPRFILRAFAAVLNKPPPGARAEP